MHSSCSRLSKAASCRGRCDLAHASPSWSVITLSSNSCLLSAPWAEAGVEGFQCLPSTQPRKVAAQPNWWPGRA
eukprot:2237993-Pleurochrysis_carterae.AAC.1